jgi:periplasmic protein TonB
MVRSWTFLLTRPSALATSVALHVSAVVAGGHALSEGPTDRAVVGALTEVEIELVDVREPALAIPSPEEQMPSPSAVGRANAGHRHAYRTPADHDARPHDPSIVHVLGPEPPPAAVAPLVAEASVHQPLHFVLAPESSLSTRGGAAGAARMTSPAELGGAIATAESDTGTTFTESAVDVKARLSSSVPVIYPEAARAAEAEADVRLELVVDADGRVVTARSLAEHGLGLDEAACRAVRAYRFTPARRAGRPVGVRMEWTVAFRLQ